MSRKSGFRFSEKGHAQLFKDNRRRVELVPEFRRLVAYVPLTLSAARREHALFRARRFFIAANARNQAVEAVLRQRHLQTFGLARRRTRRRRQGLVDRFDRRAWLD